MRTSRARAPTPPPATISTATAVQRDGRSGKSPETGCPIGIIQPCCAAAFSRRFLLVSALLGGFTLVGTAAAPLRVVAVGDVHGALTEFVTVLQRTGFIDAKRRWTGRTATLVQIGDIMDRGARVRETLDFAMDLEKQAGRAGGAFVPLLGNHEAMNVMGDLRYVTPEIYRTFATDRSEEVRAKAFRDYVEFLSAHVGHVHSLLIPADEAARKKWMDTHPLGFFEYRDAVGSNGKYGRWIRRRPAIVQIGDGLFVHGGLNPALPFESVAALDAQVRAELGRFDDTWQALSRAKVVWPYMTLRDAIAHLEEEQKSMQAQAKPADPVIAGHMQRLLGYRQWMASSSDGPLWYRGLTKDAEPTMTAGLEALLARFGARYMVVGHTVMAKATVTAWLANRVFAIDTGMLPEDTRGARRRSRSRTGDLRCTTQTGRPRRSRRPRCCP